LENVTFKTFVVLGFPFATMTAVASTEYESFPTLIVRYVYMFGVPVLAGIESWKECCSMTMRCPLAGTEVTQTVNCQLDQTNNDQKQAKLSCLGTLID